MTKRKSRLQKFISKVLTIAIIFIASNLALSWIADWSAYREPVAVNKVEWNAIFEKMQKNMGLNETEYQTVFSQTGLGKSAVNKLLRTRNYAEIQNYYNYYMQNKDFECARDGILAYHEYITDENGNRIENPKFADLQNGDIIITLSIHSFGWRHGHAAIVTDAYNGETVQAVMLGEQSTIGNVTEWNQFPLVAVLRVKDMDRATRQKVADYAKNNLVGLEYSLFAGMFGSQEETLTQTHCAHLVWYAYNQFGVDLDSTGGDTVTPKDILKSDKLEIVQVYGNIDQM